MNKQELNRILDLHKMWLFEESGKRADLREANLGGADLREVNLREANLGGADLREVNLRWADLREANLRGAYLRWADLGGADLGGADLGEANLRGADLREANLRGADLRGADLGGADLGGADLGGANLDFMSFYLHCKSFTPQTNRRQRVQLLFHWMQWVKNANNIDGDEKSFFNAMIEYANEFHRDDVDRLEALK